MKWLLVLLPAGLLLILYRAVRRRRSDRDDASYVQQLARWHTSDPQIAPLALPRVRPLQGQTDRFTRFRRRSGGER